MRIVNKFRNTNNKIVSLKEFSNEYLDYHKSGWNNYFHEAKDSLYSLLPKFTAYEYDLLNDLIDDFDNIIKATPKEIPPIIVKYTNGNYANLLIDLSGKKTELCKDIALAFSYKKFRSSAKASWFAEKIDIKACLYCNAQFTLAVGKKGASKKLLFQLDHFYNKDKYPFLSLTLGNLIPCCSICNITKSKKDFNLVNDFHPFHEDINSQCKFYIQEENILKYLIETRNKNLLLPNIKSSSLKISKFINEFRIQDIYNKHTDIIEEIILKSLYYNESKINELQKTFEELNLDKSTLDRFILGNYTLESEINNRPLSKLSQDIGKQLKLIK